MNLLILLNYILNQSNFALAYGSRPSFTGKNSIQKLDKTDNTNKIDCLRSKDITSCTLFNNGFGEQRVSLKLNMSFKKVFDNAINDFAFSTIKEVMKEKIKKAYGDQVKKDSIEYLIDYNPNGLFMEMSGPNHKLFQFAKNVFDTVKNRNQFNEEQFIKGRDIRYGLSSSISSGPLVFLSNLYSTYIVNDPYVITKKYLDWVKTLSYEKEQDLIKQFDLTHIKILTVGNFKRQQQNDLVAYMSSLIDKSEGEKNWPNKSMLPGLDIKIYKYNSEGTTVSNVIKLGESNSINVDAFTQILKVMLNNTATEETQKQKLGNEFGVIDFESFPSTGLTLYIKAEKTAEELDQVMKTIFNSVKEKLNKLTAIEEDNLKKKAIDNLLIQDQSLDSLVKRHWSTILNNQYFYAKNDHIIAAIRNVRIADLNQFFNQKFFNSKERSQFQIILSKDAPKSKFVDLDEPQEVGKAFMNVPIRF